MRGTAAILLVVLLVAPISTAGWAAVPEPPLVVDAGATDGQVRLDPPAQAVEGESVSWLLTNGGRSALTFALTVHALEQDAAGDVQVGEEVDAPGLERTRVRLDAGEAVRIPLRVEADPPRALALVATSVDADPETAVSGIVLLGGGGPVVPTVTSTDPADGTFVVRLESQGPTLVDVALRAVAWPGSPGSTTTVEGVYVPAGGRDLEVEVDGLLAGRVTIDVAVGDGDGERTRTTAWWWPPWTLLVLAGLVALVVAAGAWRRRRGRGATRGFTEA